MLALALLALTMKAWARRCVIWIVPGECSTFLSAATVRTGERAQRRQRQGLSLPAVEICLSFWRWGDGLAVHP